MFLRSVQAWIQHGELGEVGAEEAAIPSEETIGVQSGMAGDEKVGEDSIPAATLAAIRAPTSGGKSGRSAVKRMEPDAEPFQRLESIGLIGKGGGYFRPDHVACNQCAVTYAAPHGVA